MVIDEYRIGVAPIIAGSGRPLFQKGTAPRPLTLVSSQQLSTGGLIMTFKTK
jgi:dihydrofolate reductase